MHFLHNMQTRNIFHGRAISIENVSIENVSDERAAEGSLTRDVRELIMNVKNDRTYKVHSRPRRRRLPTRLILSC